MGRPTREERRIELLRTGAELATEPGPDGEVRALANVTVAAVAQRAGVSRGTIYHLWPTQEAYRCELMGRLQSRPTQASGSARDLDSEIQAAVRQLFEQPAFRAWLSFMPYASTPTATGLLSEGDRAMLDRVMRAIDHHLSSSRRRLRPGYSSEHLRTTVSSIVQGLGVVGLMSQDPDGTIDIEMLSTSAVESVTSVVVHFSEPAT